MIGLQLFRENNGFLAALMMGCFAAVASGQLAGNTPPPQTSEVATAGTRTIVDSRKDVPGGGAEKRLGPLNLENYHWDFGRPNDLDSDDQPDGWHRKRGRGYPNYIRVQITPHQPQWQRRLRQLDTAVILRWPGIRKNAPLLPELPPSIADALVDRYLRVEMDGGKVMLTSSPIPASSMFQYRFSCRVKTEQLIHDRVSAEVVFTDDQHVVLKTQSTPVVTGNRDWQTLVIEKLKPPADATLARVRLHVQGGNDGQEDLRAVVGFDNIAINQFPQLQISTDRRLGIYRVGDTVTARAKVMGLPVDESEVVFRLLDRTGTEVNQAVRGVALPRRRRSDDGLSVTPPESLDAEVKWDLADLSPGYYRVTAALRQQGWAKLQMTSLATETTVAVIDTLVDSPPHGAFGWTLPQRMYASNDAKPLDSRKIAPWLADLGVAWVKYPCWFAPQDTESAEAATVLFSRLQDRGIQTIGVLDRPPSQRIDRYQLRSRNEVVAAALFRNQQVWRPELEPIMTRMTLKVRVWQLGADRDHSFLGRSRLSELIQSISEGLQGYGQPIDVALSWPWVERQLQPKDASWQATCRSASPNLTAQELDEFLRTDGDGKSNSGPRRWILLSPIAKSRYTEEQRIQDLMLRMATVRNHRVQAAFVSEPSHPEHGLLRPDGRPAEMLLPWRTTSRLIGDLQSVGSIVMRGGSRNLVFANGERSVLMVWSSEPKSEEIYLGANAEVIDAWGRRTRPSIASNGRHPVQRIEVGPIPKFIVNIDPMLIRFRMAVELNEKQLDSLLGRSQSVSITFANPERNSAGGTMKLLEPEGWTVERGVRNFDLYGSRSLTERFDVVLGNQSTVGQYELPIEFVFDTLPPQAITVYRSLRVGPSGLDIRVTTRLVGGMLQAEVLMTSRSESPQSYDCMMLAPGSGRLYKQHFITLLPGESVKRIFSWDQGEPLVGRQLWLKAVEQDGQRVLNYTVTA
ncbi:MAG: hypothetical protein AAGA03_11195, partial [Planctomycetota bacterium]